MRLLLDTHALLWALAGDNRLRGQALAMIIDPANQVLVSVVSLWEIEIKARIGKLNVHATEIAKAAADARMDLLGVTLPHLKTLRALPSHHRDPFDHLLLAQAATEDATFVSQDEFVSHYKVRWMACS